MGMFLNRGITEFDRVVNSKIYVDKSDMLQIFIDSVNTEQSYFCISRPRRFGKTVAANMIASYFEKGNDSRYLFEERKLGKIPDWDKYLNRFDVIRIDIADVISSTKSPEEALDYIEQNLIEDLDKAYPGFLRKEWASPGDALARINEAKGLQFIIIIDEWDALFRDEKNNRAVQDRYLKILRSLFKGNRSKKFTALAYITGILPIKKYNSESALNNFDEYTMLDPGPLAQYTGFTTEEVCNLCTEYDMDFETALDWYDGYTFDKDLHIFGPNSVVKSMHRHRYANYWSQTAAYTSLSSLISMDFEGLREDIISMLAGHKIPVNTLLYQNDMVSFRCKDDALTVLIHLGYLAYDLETESAYIPNKEVRQIFELTLRDIGWDSVARAIQESDRLLKLTLAGEEEAVAEAIDRCHRENTSIKRYNDETALDACIRLAYYTAVKDYVIFPELEGGYGFADLVFLPRKHSTKPAMIVELKWNQKAMTAIRQIEDRKYIESLKDYNGEVLLVGINYDKQGPKAKHHTCIIKKVEI